MMLAADAAQSDNNTVLIQAALPGIATVGSVGLLMVGLLCVLLPNLVL